MAERLLGLLRGDGNKASPAATAPATVRFSTAKAWPGAGRVAGQPGFTL